MTAAKTATKPNLHDDIEYLICDVGLLWRKLYNQEAKKLGLGTVDRRAMIYIERNPGLTQVQLADFLEMDPQGLTRILDRLEQKGWLEKQTSANDRRAKCLFISKQGKPILTKLRKSIDQLRPSVLKNISQSEINAVNEILSKMKLNIASSD